jgi:sterol desaturase/sphingolipid hydroxylase (fatty acid hydroxylase superfamily)
MTDAGAPGWLLAHEPALRLGGFLGVLMLMAAWEALAPRRPRSQSRLRRWPGNLGVVAIGTLLLRLVVPLGAVGMAAIAARHGWGLLNALALPGWAGMALAILLLDLAIYLQHRVFHAVPLLWRLHRMHHADLDLDVTSGVRFHPVELVLSMLIKLAVVAALGAPAAAVLLFEVVLNASAMFNHANARLPAALDAALRALLVTPDMHRVHHSVVRAETDSNFGFCLSWWDRLLGTYRPTPAAGQLGMTIGLPAFREPADLRLDRMLLQPLA